MHKLLTNLGLISLAIVFGVCIGTCIGKASTQYLICRYYTWDHPEGKIVRCAKTGSDVAGNYATEIEPTATGIVYPTDTPEPEVTETPTVKETLTVEPYPPPATWTPEPPYPIPQDWLYWWRR